MFFVLSKLDNFLEQLGPVKFFILAALVFGGIFLAVTPPFEAPDESVHFLRAYQVSQLNFIVDKTPSGVIGGVLPSSLGYIEQYTMTGPTIPFHPNYKYNIKKTYHALFVSKGTKNQAYDFSSTTLYPPVAYLPQATGIAIARLLRLSPMVMMYAGRLFNLITWIVLLAVAIKVIPIKKWALVFIGLIPMAVSQAASLSADVMTVGLVILFVAYILKLLKEKQLLNRKDFLVLLIVTSALLLCKQAMIVFLPLILLLPETLFKNKKTARVVKAVLILMPLILLAAWFGMIHGLSSVADYANHQNPTEQIKFVLIHPYSFINVLWNTYFFQWGDSITRSFIGDFGWSDTPLAISIVVVGYACLAFVLLATDSTSKVKDFLNKRQKLLIASVAFAYWLAVSAALYAYYSPVGFKIIVGLQGRYFLPVALCLIPVLFSDWLRTSTKSYKNIVIYSPIFLLICSVITIFVRFYVSNV